jgi:Flp pilus assembly protein TadG
MLKRGSVKRLWRDDQGAVALTLALSLVPLSIAALGAVDLSRALAAKSQLQDALDAAALAALRASANDATLLQTAGTEMLRQNLGAAPPFTVTAGPTFAYGPAGEVIADAHASVETTLLGLASGNRLDVAAHSEIVRSDVKLEIAMVLDNTGSMHDDGKIGYLITAASNFVDTMAKAAAERRDADAVRISLVPFSNTVRLDPNVYGSATWVDQKGASPINQGVAPRGWKLFDKKISRFTLFKNLGSSWAGCVETRTGDYDVYDSPPTTKDRASLITPFFAPDEDDTLQFGNNYVHDPSTGDWIARQSNTAKYTTINTSKPLTTDSGPNAGCALEPLMPLTTAFASLKSAISGMTPIGDTNIPMGLVWGWHTLSPGGPFTGASAYDDPKHSKIVVLMSDGRNQFTAAGGAHGANMTAYEGLGYVWQERIPGLIDGDQLNSAALNARMALVCSHMKEKRIEIYTVAVEGRDVYDTGPLKDCATDADHFYDVSNGAGLNAAFQAIAGQIANMHLAR